MTREEEDENRSFVVVHYPGGGIDTCDVVKPIDCGAVQAKVDASFKIHQLSAQSM